MIASFIDAVVGFLPAAAFAAVMLVVVILVGSALTDFVRECRRATNDAHHIDMAHRQARRAMNDAARKSWRNIIE